jgi:hypothetical protein
MSLILFIFNLLSSHTYILHYTHKKDKAYIGKLKIYKKVIIDYGKVNIESSYEGRYFSMYNYNFFKGMGAGLAVGMAIGIAIIPKKKTKGTMSGKLIKTVGDIVDNVSEYMTH